MSAKDSDSPQLRRRGKPASSDSSTGGKVAAEDRAGFGLTDLLRLLGGLILLSGILSYFVTNDSLIWNARRPWWLRLNGIQAYVQGPRDLTDAELARYDGEKDTSLPILLAVNGTIFDVSASPQFYGPGGAYHVFAGRDGSRAFVTGCFETDLTPDLRGAEQMHLPLEYDTDDTQTKEGSDGQGGKIAGRELKLVREKERREALKKVKDALAHWEGFFSGNEKYTKAGKVLREENWNEGKEVPGLCAQAQQGRKHRGF